MILNQCLNEIAHAVLYHHLQSTPTDANRDARIRKSLSFTEVASSFNQMPLSQWCLD